MADLEKLTVTLTAKIDQYERELAKANALTLKAFRSMEGGATRSMKRIEGRFAKFGATLSSGIGSGFGGGLLKGGLAGLISSATAGQLTAIVKSVAYLADEAKRAGVSAEALQEIGYAAEQSGANVLDVVDALSKLNQKIGEAQVKGNDLGKLFANNNIKISTDPIENFKAVADLVRNAKNEQERAVVGAAAFGKEWKTLLPLLSKGADAISQSAQEARNLGAVISEETVRKANEFDSRWKTTWAIWSARGKSAIIDVLSEMDQLLGKITSGIDAAIAKSGVSSLDLKNGPGLFAPGLNEQQIAQLETFFPSLRNNNAKTIDQQRLEANKALLENTQKRAELEQHIKDIQASGGAPIEIEEFQARLDNANKTAAELQARLQSLQTPGSAVIPAPSYDPLSSVQTPKPPPTNVSGLATTKTKTGGGGGGSSVSERSPDSFANEIENYQKLTQEILQEQEALGKTSAEMAKMKATQDLLNAAQEAGIKITPELSGLIGQVADNYSAATAALEKMQERQQAINDLNGTLREGISGFFHDLESGSSAIDALNNALDNMISRLTDLALNKLLDQLLGTGGGGGGLLGGGGGGLGTILSTFFRASGGPVSAGRPYVVGEQGPELFVPGQSGSIVPNGRMGGGGINIKVIDNAGTTLRAQPDDSGDQRGILLVIDQRVQRQVGDPYSKTSSALTARGAKVAAKRR